MNHKEAREVILGLTSICDVVVENFTPRVMRNWGLDYAHLKPKKPDLIMLRMSGMGSTGPWKDFVAFGQTIQSLSGMTFLTSYTGHNPTGLGYAYADHIAGLYGTIAILAALEHRERTGRGLLIDLSEYEAMCSLTVPALVASSRNETKDYIDSFINGVYACKGKDQWCAITVNSEAQWEVLCNVIGRNTGWQRTDFIIKAAMATRWKGLYPNGHQGTLKMRYFQSCARQAYRPGLSRTPGTWPGILILKPGNISCT